MSDYQRAANISQIAAVLIAAVMLWIMIYGVPGFLKSTVPETVGPLPQSEARRLLDYAIPAIFVLGLLGAATLNYKASRSHPTRLPSAGNWSEVQTIVHGKTFINERVDLDNISFHRCTFINAKLMYHGHGPTMLVECKIGGSLAILTDHPAAKAFFVLMERAKAQPGGAEIKPFAADRDGNLKPLE